MHFGSPTNSCPLIVLGRCSQKLSLTLENSHESKPCFLDQPLCCKYAYLYLLSIFLASGDVAQKHFFLEMFGAFFELIHVASHCHAFDYSGIIFLIVGSFYPSVYYRFFCDLHVQVFYLAVIIIAGLGKIMIVFLL